MILNWKIRNKIKFYKNGNITEGNSPKLKLLIDNLVLKFENEEIKLFDVKPYIKGK